ncbi:MAG: alpha-amylase [Chloroflexi bacterium]|nr:alpha-amylase [Chloroflexota bacterium]
MKRFWNHCTTPLVALLLAACARGAPTAASAELPSPPPAGGAVQSQPAPPTGAVVSTASAQPAAGHWWDDAVFYEVFVRSFKDSDGDGIGDLNGLIEKLDYLNDGDPATTADLGVTGLWLMPIMQSPSYHGYDVTDYYTVEQDYGTNGDFQRLMDEAHRRGIKVIVDLVLNHTSSDHPWFQESYAGDPDYRDWYVWVDQAPSYRGPWGQQVWYTGKGGYYYAVFWSRMPDLNLQNPAVTAEIDNAVRYWLEELGADGFRMDAIRYYVENGIAQADTPGTHAWLQAFHQFYKGVNPQALTVGEAWTDTAHVVEYAGDEVDIAFEFDLASSFLTAASGPIAGAATQQLQLVLDSYPAGQYGVFLTNHDQDRVMSVLRDPQKARLAAVMMLTAPGVPFVYYGEEIGMTGVKPDENIRRPMQWSGADSKVGFSTHIPWNAASRDYQTTNVAAQTGDPDSLLSLYRQLIQLRNQHAALRAGQTLVVDAGTPRLYAVLRYNGQEAFLILVNVHPRPLTADLYSLTLERGPFKGPLTAASILGLENPAAPEVNASGGFSDYHPLAEIPAQSAVMIRLAP